MQSAAVYIETDPDDGTDHERFFTHAETYLSKRLFSALDLIRSNSADGQAK